MGSNQSKSFRAEVVARGNGGEYAAIGIGGAIDSDSGTTAILGEPFTIVYSRSDEAFGVTATADNQNNNLLIQVKSPTGQGLSIQWGCSAEVTTITHD